MSNETEAKIEATPPAAATETPPAAAPPKPLPFMGLAGRYLTGEPLKVSDPTEGFRARQAATEHAAARRHECTRAPTDQEREQRTTARIAAEQDRAARAQADATHRQRLAAAKAGSLQPPPPSVRARNMQEYRELTVEQQREIEIYNAASTSKSTRKGGW